MKFKICFLMVLIISSYVNASEPLSKESRVSKFEKFAKKHEKKLMIDTASIAELQRVQRAKELHKKLADEIAQAEFQDDLRYRLDSELADAKQQFSLLPKNLASVELWHKQSGDLSKRGAFDRGIMYLEEYIKLGPKLNSLNDYDPRQEIKEMQQNVKKFSNAIQEYEEKMKCIQGQEAERIIELSNFRQKVKTKWDDTIEDLSNAFK